VIPFTGDTHELQFRKSPAQQWFLGLYHRTSAPLLNAQKSFSNDSQGMYIVGPDGTSYGYTNDHDPSNINEALDNALRQYHAHPPKQVTITEAELRTPYAVAPPTTATVVRVFTRIMPLPQGCIGLNSGIGRDYLWIYAEEVRKMQALAAQSTKPFKLPATLALRIARYHLVDNVRGSPDMWGLKELKRLHFVARVADRNKETITLAFSGSFQFEHNGQNRRGYEGRIEGNFAMSATQPTISRFRALAKGKAWGDGAYNPNAPKGRYPLVVAMVQATDPVARVVPPEAVSTENNDQPYRDPTLPSNIRP
jgi:hypothetical protein